MSPSTEDQLTSALESLGQTLTANFASSVTGQPEDQLKGPIQVFLGRVGTAFSRTVIARTESSIPGLGIRPDIAVEVNGWLAGYVELKAPGRGARPGKFKGREAKQWGKFTALPNLIYSDGNEWALYRTGQLIGKVVRLRGDLTSDGTEAFTFDDLRDLSALLHDFLAWRPTVPSSPRVLAEVLAPLCRLLREDVLAAVSTPGTALSLLGGEWRMYLFPDADDAQFADAYAQTLTYALLLARFEGVTDLHFEAPDALDRRHGLLAQVLRVLAQPEARKEIAVPLALLERSIEAVDPAALSRRGDPWLYFYEDFLAAYDEKLRKNRGVYYTPAQVVEAQVKLVGQLLEGAFDKALAFVDDDVIFLDPAVGTGTYPLAALQFGLDKVEQYYGGGATGQRATIAARNFHAFEILVGPYAVAHLRLSQKVLQSEGSLPHDGIHVYLADTLESPFSAPPGQLTLDLLHRRLSEESKRARDVKANTRILVCMGNPPYYRQTIRRDEVGVERQGGWVRFGDDGRGGILEDFLRPVREAGLGVHIKNLYNLYVYFWRWALWKVLDSTAGAGIVSFITASSYLRGPGFIGMRQVMRETFDEMWIIDLEGDNAGPRKTDNVFAIQTAVAIAIGVRYGSPQPDVPAHVRYVRITGSRSEKLAKLHDIKRFEDIDWRDCFKGWTKPLLPESAGDYFDWPLLGDIFPWQYSGVEFKRTWPIAPTRDALLARWKTFMGTTRSRRADAFRETGFRSISGEYKSLDGGEYLPPIAGLRSDAPGPEVVRYGYRSFDRQWTFADSRLSDRMRPPLWQVRSNAQVYMTSLLTGVLGLGQAATVTAHVPDLHHFRGSFGGADVIPLWRDKSATKPNITSGLTEVLGRVLGVEISAEELFTYCYALLAAPSYVEKFSEELVIPGPRVPITKDRDLFRTSVALGRQLIHLHTYGERMPRRGVGRGRVPRGNARATVAVPTLPSKYPNAFRYHSRDKELHVGEGVFAPVGTAVWDFSVSGLQVVRSWLGYRMADRAGRKSSSLDDIRPGQWTADLTEELLHLLWVLEATIAIQPDLDANLASVVEGSVFKSDELPEPTPEGRRAPSVTRLLQRNPGSRARQRPNQG